MPIGGVELLSQGALIKTFPVASHNIVLGFPEAELYRSNNTAYFGETIGRISNRVKDAILIIDGIEYPLPRNEGHNCLHGGNEGWGKKQFQGPWPVQRHGREATHFTYLSPDGEEGFPGTLECRVWYSTTVEPSHSVLEVEYEVEFTGDECQETAVALTNHSYFNLSPGPTIAGTQVSLSTDRHLELDEKHIPTGKIVEFGAGKSFTLGDTHPVIDECFVMSPEDVFSSDTRSQALRIMAQMYHPETDLHLEISSTEPAFQLYTGDGIDVPSLRLADGHQTSMFGPRSGIAVEPCRYVDSQRREWSAQCRVRRGEKWGSRIQYRAWTGQATCGPL